MRSDSIINFNYPIFAGQVPTKKSTALVQEKTKSDLERTPKEDVLEKNNAKKNLLPILSFVLVAGAFIVGSLSGKEKIKTICSKKGIEDLSSLDKVVESSSEMLNAYKGTKNKLDNILIHPQVIEEIEEQAIAKLSKKTIDPMEVAAASTIATPLALAFFLENQLFSTLASYSSSQEELQAAEGQLEIGNKVSYKSLDENYRIYTSSIRYYNEIIEKFNVNNEIRFAPLPRCEIDGELCSAIEGARRIFPLFDNLMSNPKAIPDEQVLEMLEKYVKSNDSSLNIFKEAGSYKERIRLNLSDLKMRYEEAQSQNRMDEYNQNVQKKQKQDYDDTLDDEVLLMGAFACEDDFDMEDFIDIF